MAAVAAVAGDHPGDPMGIKFADVMIIPLIYDDYNVDDGITINYHNMMIIM